MDDLDYPILVGVGQITDRGDDPTRSLEPVELMAESCREAERDAGIDGLLRRVDSVRVVNLVSWSYGNAPGALATRLGIQPREHVYTTVGGNTPQFLINQTADELARGEIGVAIVAGAEAMYAQRLARQRKVKLEWMAPSGAPDRVVGDARWGTQDLETRHGAAVPIQIYPLFENALRASRGQSIEQQRAELGTLCERFSTIAAGNAYSWFREPKSAAEITNVTPVNRMIGFPYPKFMNSILDVNQGAAVILTTVRTARELRVPEDRWVYLLGGGDAHDHWHILERESFHTSPAIRCAARAALEQAEIGIESVDFLDLYSCFPCAPRIGRDMLGIPADDPRDLTVTGSLLYFGGPGSNHPLHAVAAMAPRLRARPESTGLVTGLGWYVTKHAVGIYSATPPKRPWNRRDPAEVQREVDAGPRPDLAIEPEGTSRIETYTVLHDREGAPERGIVVGRLDDGRRFIANPPADRGLLEDMERVEMIGTPGRVRGGGPDDTSVWEPS